MKAKSIVLTRNEAVEAIVEMREEEAKAYKEMFDGEECREFLKARTDEEIKGFYAECEIFKNDELVIQERCTSNLRH